jgi:hypothetical protein
VQPEPKILELPPNFQGRITYQEVASIEYEEVSELLSKVSEIPRGDETNPDKSHFAPEAGLHGRKRV